MGKVFLIKVSKTDKFHVYGEIIREVSNDELKNNV